MSPAAVAMDGAPIFALMESLNCASVAFPMEVWETSVGNPKDVAGRGGLLG
jgi:hypothetical protein